MGLQAGHGSLQVLHREQEAAQAEGEGWQGPEYERYPGRCQRLRFTFANQKPSPRAGSGTSTRSSIAVQK